MRVNGWLARRLVRALLARLGGAAFGVVYWDGTEEQFGKGAPAFRLRIHDPGCLTAILCAPELGMGEALMEGRIEVDRLDAFLEFAFSREWRVRPPAFSLPRLSPLWERRSFHQQRKDIEHHYELGNSFFALWLDPSLAYTCAYFETPDASLEEAQAAKWRHTLRKLQLGPGHRLLDIGCGWGALLFGAAQQYGAHAHGITLSQQQYDFVQERTKELGLQDRVSVELIDYRELARRECRFDRVSTVGMFEHVGEGNHADYMRAVSRLLKPGGLLLLHTITRRKDAPSDAWLRRYIFPGTHIISWTRVVGLLAEFGFELLDVEDWWIHYPRTAQEWLERFESRLPEVRALGYDERFIRMWRLYLSACIAGFLYRDYSIHQFVASFGRAASPKLTRAHLYDAPTRGDVCR